MVKSLRDQCAGLVIPGLPGNTLAVYLSLLKLGGWRTAMPVARLAGLARSTVQGNLEFLFRSGLVSRKRERGVNLYEAKPVSRVRDAYREFFKRATLSLKRLEVLARR